jgi:methionyl-tRNA formyltransferase
MSTLRIILMGTPDFAVPAFEAAIRSDHDIVAIYTQPPRPKGRGHKVQKSPVQSLAETHNIPVFHPPSIKGEDEIKHFQSLKPDLAIVAAYGLILPKAILDAPTHGCVNIHASLLPKWRGASPIQHAIWKGDTETGITLMQMDVGLDTGDMIVKETIPITAKTNAPVLHDNLAQLAAGMMERFLKNPEFSGEKQDDTQSNYAPLLKKSDGVIDWNDNAENIDRQIRALNPWPGVFTTVHGKRLKVLSAQPLDTPTNQPIGTVINKSGDVACGDNTVLTLITVQPEGKKPMAFADALNGGYIKIGKQFE